MAKQKILVADDDQGVAKAVSLRLVGQGYQVITASDGYTAFARASKENPDLLILDINMPAGDGFSVQKRMEQSSFTQNIPVIYMTGNQSYHVEKYATNFLEAFALVHKPLEMDGLLAKVQEALAVRAA